MSEMTTEQKIDLEKLTAHFHAVGVDPENAFKALAEAGAGIAMGIDHEFMKRIRPLSASEISAAETLVTGMRAGSGVAPLTVAALVEESYGTAKAKGWHEEDKPATVGDRLMLMVTELAEAMEEHRRNIPPGRIYFNHPTAGKCDYVDDLLPSWKPEGFVVELADTIIRICDMAGKYELPLERALRLKLRFNKTREHRHGGKAL